MGQKKFYIPSYKIPVLEALSQQSTSMLSMHVKHDKNTKINFLWGTKEKPLVSYK